MSDEKPTLADERDAWNFYVGRPVEMVWLGDGKLRRATRWERLRNRVRRTVLRWTRWFRPRDVTSAVDVKNGTLTISSERWSWLRWRWERR